MLLSRARASAAADWWKRGNEAEQSSINGRLALRRGLCLGWKVEAWWSRDKRRVGARVLRQCRRGGQREMSLVLSWKSELDWPNGTAALGTGKLMWGSSAEPMLRIPI